MSESTAARRTTLLYVGMVGVLAGGLWLILKVGSRLTAPMDLSGNWELHDLAASAGRRQSGVPKRASIEQSGIFVTMRLEQQPPLDMRVVKDEAAGTSGGRVIKLAGEKQRVTIYSPAQSGGDSADSAEGAWRFVFEGAIEGTGVGEPASDDGEPPAHARGGPHG